MHPRQTTIKTIRKTSWFFVLAGCGLLMALSPACAVRQQLPAQVTPLILTASPNNTSPTLTPPLPTVTSSPQPSPSSTPIADAEPTTKGTMALPQPDALSATLVDGVSWKVLVKEIGRPEALFALNPNEEFHPASMLKIPLAMIVLDIQAKEGRNLAELSSVGIGNRNFSALLEAMVVRSENEATAILEYYARGGNRLRDHLDGWGLAHTGFEPMRSTATDLGNALEGLYSGSFLQEPYRGYLLDLMESFTENDTRYLGVINDTLDGCQLYNKRGELLNPTVVSDMGILTCPNHAFVIVISGTPAVDSQATFESILVNLESFARELGTQLSAIIME